MGKGHFTGAKAQKLKPIQLIQAILSSFSVAESIDCEGHESENLFRDTGRSQIPGIFLGQPILPWSFSHKSSQLLGNDG